MISRVQQQCNRRDYSVAEYSFVGGQAYADATIVVADWWDLLEEECYHLQLAHHTFEWVMEGHQDSTIPMAVHKLCDIKISTYITMLASSRHLLLLYAARVW